MIGPGSDVRHALRLLRQQPGFTAIALLTLALGIGATTAIFSVVNAVVLRPLPYEASDRLIRVFENNPEKGWTTFAVAPANFVDWARESRTFESMTAFMPGTAALLAGDTAEQVRSTNASAEFFTVLRAQPHAGRGFNAGDDVPGAEPVAVISHGLWQRRFGGATSLVGQVVTINDRPTTIVGVMPEGFSEGEPGTDLWLPLPLDRQRAERGGRSLAVLGRLAPTATIEQARAEMQAISERLARQFPANAGWSVTLIRLEEVTVGRGVRQALAVLLGAVGMVLLIACVNVANLLSARGVARQREMAIRAALGAGRWRLTRQLLTESAVLATLGGFLGLLVAVWGSELLLALAPPTLPRLHEVGIDVRVLAVGVGVTAVAALVFSLAPALQTFLSSPDHVLKEATRGGTASPARARLSFAFIVAEIALAVVLLVGAGLLLRSFTRLSSQPIGFDPSQTLTFRLVLPETRYGSPAQVAQFFDEALDRIRRLPGVRAVGATHALPFSGLDSVRPFLREGDLSEVSQAPTSNYRLVTPGYFAALGIPVTRGREFTSADVAGQPGAVIVNESFVRRFLAGREVLGRRLRQAGDNPAIPWMTLVGVVGDVRHTGLASEPQPEMFWPAAQATWGDTLNRHRRGLTVVVRTTGDPPASLPLIRSQIATLDPHRPLIDVRLMSELIERSVADERFSMVLLAIFALVGLVLAAAGVYGVMSYTVARGTREMGIRLALGARPSELLRQVLRTGLQLAAAGASLGLLTAWALDDVLRSQLFQIAPRDGVTFAAVALLLLGTALLACYIPARRAARIDPIRALREE